MCSKLTDIPRPDATTTVSYTHLDVYKRQALAWGMPAGLASLVLQVQTVFTVVIASLWLRERPTAYQLSGIAVGLARCV